VVPALQGPGPILDELASEHGEAPRVRKVNADEHPRLSARFEVVAVPMILLFVDGEVRQRLVGARSQARLAEEPAQAVSS
jgi:thioredoxin 1